MGSSARALSSGVRSSPDGLKGIYLSILAGLYGDCLGYITTHPPLPGSAGSNQRLPLETCHSLQDVAALPKEPGKDTEIVPAKHLTYDYIRVNRFLTETLPDLEDA